MYFAGGIGVFAGFLYIYQSSFGKEPFIIAYILRIYV